MKTSSAVLSILVASSALFLVKAAATTAATAAATDDECVIGSFRLEIDGACTPTSIIEAYEEQVYYATGGINTKTCTTSAQDDLLLKLGRSSSHNTLQSLCDELYANQIKVPFTQAANRGDDYYFEQMFYNGRTNWQEDVETTSNAHHPTSTTTTTTTNILKEDAEAVRVFFEGIAQGRRVEWPGEMVSNFQSSVTDTAGLSTCTTNAAMCCWPKDRQANDNNGNCATPYDENCVNKDPADNTNLCIVDLTRSSSSDGYVSNTGFLGFPEDNDDGEGAIHCHGFAWSNDVNDRTSRYKANNLFFVSMYDHMYQRGYVKNIPGAPMCGCVEQMPTVTRSDCTQVDLTENFIIDYSSGEFTTKLTGVHVDFNSCQGINNQNNDLWAYMARLYYQGDITPQQFGEAGRIITNDNYGCTEVSMKQLSERNNLQRGYMHDKSMWTKVAGRDSLKQTENYGPRAFLKSLRPSTTIERNATIHYGIIMRICATCTKSHQKMYYRRLTPPNEDLNLLYNILYYENDAAPTNNTWNVDFTLHSTYEDAVSGTNAWLCPDGKFYYPATFYGECSPTGVKVYEQYSRFSQTWAPNKLDVAYYVNKAEEDGLQEVSTLAIKGYPYSDIGGWAKGIALKDDSNGKIYMSGVGHDIWYTKDDFLYHYEKFSGDYTAIVNVEKMSNVQSWSKAGIMFRKNLTPGSVHFSAMLFGTEGVGCQARDIDSDQSFYTSPNPNPKVKTSWLRVRKAGNTFTASSGLQVAPNGTITWTVIHTRTMPEMDGDEYYIGLAVSSNNWDRNIATEAVFSNYQVTVSTDPPTNAPTSSPTRTPTTGKPTQSPTYNPTTRTPTTATPTTTKPTASATSKPTTKSPTTRNPTNKPSTKLPTIKATTAKPSTKKPV